MSEGTVPLESSLEMGPLIHIWSSMGWPQVTLLLGVLSVIIFRKEIGGLIGRLTKIGASGITVSPSLNPVQPKASTEESVSSAVVNTDHLKDYPNLTNQQKENLRKEILAIDRENLVGYLTENLAYARGLWVFENIFNFIYAGQIALLNMLNRRQGVGLAKSDLPILWAQHQKKLSPILDSWDGEVYMSFLYAHGLIMDQGETVQITRIGVEFLTWMARNGRYESMRAL